MNHSPIQISNASLCFPHKTCFDEFNAKIFYGSQIAIIGSNGSGKSTLLKIIRDNISLLSDVVYGYVPQIIEDFDTLSGGQRFHQALTQALSLRPNVLLLDEPTNHLDGKNKKSLLKMLSNFPGTLIIISHDLELLRNKVNIFWHIDNGNICVFSGGYDDYIAEIDIRLHLLKRNKLDLKKQKKSMHESLMKEQERAAKSCMKGEKSITNRKWPTVVSISKAGRSNRTADKNQAEIKQKRQELSDKLINLALPEVIVPKFALNPAAIHHRILVSIRQGAVGYLAQEPILNNINLSVGSKDKLAIMGNNGSGKSTLIKGIMNYAEVKKSGDWIVPKIQDIGYLDQHYANFAQNKTVFEIIQEQVPNWTPIQIRRQLNDFLFRKNEEVNLVGAYLSGGEKVRLSLALIAVNTPKLLILDEITNNLDLSTREHVIQVLKNYPGAMIVVSHDTDFLENMGITDRYLL